MCVYLRVCLYYIFFIHSSVDGHLGCLHVLAIVNSAAMNLSMEVSFLNYSLCPNICPGVELLSQRWLIHSSSGITT